MATSDLDSAFGEMLKDYLLHRRESAGTPMPAMTHEEMIREIEQENGWRPLCEIPRLRGSMADYLFPEGSE